MARTFSPSGAIQRVSNQDATLIKVFYRAKAVAQSGYTTLHTVPLDPPGCRDLITFSSFVARATGANPYILFAAVYPYTGSVVLAGQGRLVADGYQWRPFSRDTPLVLSPGDSLRVIGTEAGSAGNPLAIDVYIGGTRYIPEY